jgi:hypothetical protein
MPTLSSSSRHAGRTADERRAFAGAAFGAAATFLVLLGAIAVTDVPRAPSEIPPSLASIEGLDLSPAAALQGAEDAHPQSG